MMSYRASRNVIRLHPSSSRTITSRVSAVLAGVQRVPAALNAKFEPATQSQDNPFRPIIHFLSDSRGYATRPASRPKAHTGRTTKSTRVRKPKEADIERDVKVTDKTVKPKAKPKKKTATLKSKKKPKVKAKTKPKPKAKKPVTEEKRAAAKVKEQNTRIRELKKIALTVPPEKPSTAFKVICDIVAKETRSLPGKEASARYKNLTTEEHEHYNHTANENKADNAKAYEAWIKSFTPAEIHMANNARKNLTRLGVKRFQKPLRDDRQVKRPTMAHGYFLKDRYSSGDLQGISAVEAIKQTMKEWKALGEADKQKYEKMQSESLSRYSQESQSVYRNADLSANPPAAAAAASA